MPNKRKLEDNLNKVFDCKDIHVHEVRDVDDNKLTQLLITNSNFSLRMQFVKKERRRSLSDYEFSKD